MQSILITLFETQNNDLICSEFITIPQGKKMTVMAYDIHGNALNFAINFYAANYDDISSTSTLQSGTYVDIPNSAKYFKPVIRNASLSNIYSCIVYIDTDTYTLPLQYPTYMINQYKINEDSANAVVYIYNPVFDTSSEYIYNYSSNEITENVSVLSDFVYDDRRLYFSGNVAYSTSTDNQELTIFYENINLQLESSAVQIYVEYREAANNKFDVYIKIGNSSYSLYRTSNHDTNFAVVYGDLFSNGGYFYSAVSIKIFRNGSFYRSYSVGKAVMTESDIDMSFVSENREVKHYEITVV